MRRATFPWMRGTTSARRRPAFHVRGSMSKRAKRPADKADTPASDRSIPRGTDEHSKSSTQGDDERTAAKPPHVDSEDQADGGGEST